MEKIWNVIINPNAFNIRKEKLWKEVKGILVGHEFQFSEHISHSKRDCEFIIENCINKGFKHFVIVGGDGTLNEAINAIFKYCQTPDQICVSLIPCGTGNDWSRTHNITGAAMHLAKMFIQGKIIEHDIGKIISSKNNARNEKYFINIAGLGFDAEVILRLNKSAKLRYAGKFIYLKNLFLTLLSNKPTMCHFVVNDKQFDMNVFSIAIGICKYNGGGMMQVPMANPYDGLLDMIIIEPLNLFEILWQLPKLYNGKHIAYKKVHHFRTANISITPQKTMFAEVEGEIAGDGTFEIKAIAKKIKVLIP